MGTVKSKADLTRRKHRRLLRAHQNIAAAIPKADIFLTGCCDLLTTKADVC